MTYDNLNPAPAEESAGEAGGFVPRESFEALSCELKSAREALSESGERIMRLEAAESENEALRGRVEELIKSERETAAAHEDAISKMRADHAADMALYFAKAKNITAVRALMADFLKDARADESGAVPGLSEEIERLKSDPGTSFLFGKEEGAGRISGFVPAEGEDVRSAVTLEALRRMTPDERHRFSVENPRLYKELYGGDI
ncbi:MAG: phage scaffolding protein [Clostridia bacterium]|nr:phage scaffolding protein [Clostridia bacterium]